MRDISLRALSLSYGELVVLRDLSLTLPGGTITGLLGPSGCGKTSLLHTVAHRLLADGVRVSVAFQEDRLIPHRTVRDNLLFVAPPERVEPALQLVELPDAGALYPRELSGGMRQRVSLARAIAYESEVLLLDEPFRSLDEALATRVRDRLAALCRREGRTVLLISHDPAELCAVCDRVLTASGPPLTLIEASEHA